MIEGSYGESGHDEKCEWASEACGCDSRKLLRAEIAVATKELTRLSVEIVRAERERDEARKALDSIWEVVRTGVYGPPYDFHLGQLASIRGFIDIERAARVAGGGEDE